MSKKNLYFIQPSFLYGDSLYLPYASGALAAYAFGDERIKEGYELKKIVYMREKIADSAALFEPPFVAAFSCYIWSFEYCKAFAKSLRAAFPDCTVIFGGHSIPHGTDLLYELPYVDYLIYGEGEEPFRALLSALDGKDELSSVPALSYRLPDGKSVCNEPLAPCRVDYPSPYLEGYFDKIVAESPYNFSAILETNRGCPYGCAFCDWGQLKSRVRQFPLERTFAEIEWMAKNKVKYCYCADSNFGLFERDDEIINRAIATKAQTGYPEKFRVNYAKNSNDAVFNINKKLHESGMNKGVTLSFQSMTPAVLENIGRKNITIRKFSELMLRYRDAGIPTYSELIFGMPGETYETFSESVNELFEAGQHNAMFVYNCELLVNSEMGSDDYIKRHGIKTISTPFSLDHSEPVEMDVPEYSRIVVETNTMSREEWVKTRFYSLCVQAFHCLGITQCFAIYIHLEKNVKYADFYSKLIDYFSDKPGTVCGAALQRLLTKLSAFVRGETQWTCADSRFGNIAWPLEEYLYLLLAYDIKSVYSELRGFISGFGLDASVLRELFKYQENILKLQTENSESFKLEFDFVSYFDSAYRGCRKPLVKTPCTVYPERGGGYATFEEYARETVWFGRRNGKMTYDFSAVTRDDERNL